MTTNSSAQTSEAPRFKKRAELDESELEERDVLVEMCSSLARGILQNSYYTDDHPQIRKLGDEPYAHWKKLGHKYAELSFVVASWSEEEIMALEGVFSDAVGLDALIGGTAGEHFARKMFAFSKRNRLVSFALKNTIDEEEFHRFIRVFVKRHVDMEAQHLIDAYDDSDSSGPKFTDQLLDADVINVSVVLEEDLVAEKRRLPWRVKIALARLRKDLKTIPMYSRATASELRTAKLRLLRDILRPLRRGAYLKQLFLNLDLIQQEVSELQDVALEADLFAALPDARVRALTGALLREYEKMQQPGLRRDEAQAIVFETLSRQLGIVGDLLANSVLDDEVVELLRDLFEKKAVAFEVLPASLQNDIRTDRWTANYLRDPGMFISGFDAIESAAAYVSQVPYVVGIIPNLCRVKRFEDAAKVVAVLERHRTTPGGFAERETLVNEAMDQLSGGATLELLTDAMLNEPTEVRAILRRLLAVMGQRAVPPLIRVLENSDREDVRSDCALTLIAIGEPIRELIELRLLSRHLSSDTSVYLLKVLAELADERSTDVLVSHTRHREPRVRNVALRSLVRMHGAQANNVLARATTDTSAKVAQRAIRLLADQRSKHPAYLYVLLQVLGLAPISQAERREITVKLQVTAVEALATLSFQAELGVLGRVEDLLLRCVDTGESAVVNFFQRGKTEEHDQVRVTVCRLLGEKGTEASLERLNQYAREPSPLVRTQMQQAAEKIQRRLGSSA